MTSFDVALLLAAIAAALFWSACFGYLSGDSRADVGLIAAAGAFLGGAAVVTALM